MTILIMHVFSTGVARGLLSSGNTKLCDVRTSDVGSGTITLFKKIGVECARAQAIKKCAIMRGGGGGVATQVIKRLIESSRFFSE